MGYYSKNPNTYTQNNFIEIPEGNHRVKICNVKVERFRFDPSIRDSIRKQWRLEDCFVLGTVGSITKVKNPFGLLDIFERVYRKNSGARLLWVGEGDLREEIEELVQARGLQGVVHFTGMREDVECMMQAMDVFVFPSLWEGLGMAVIEAQAAGLTCVCSDNVPREVNVSGLCSFFSLGQIEQWVNCIMAISGKRQDMTEIVRKAGYDVRDTGKKMEAFYCEINESMRTEVRCS